MYAAQFIVQDGFAIVYVQNRDAPDAGPRPKAFDIGGYCQRTEFDSP